MVRRFNLLILKFNDFFFKKKIYFIKKTDIWSNFIKFEMKILRKI